MRSLRSVAFSSLVLVLAALDAGSCTDAATTGPTFPLGAEVVPLTYTTLSVAQLPPFCSGQTYFQATTALCPPGLTYFLCDGSSYTEYDCASPGSGWSQETLAEDRVATGPMSCPSNGSMSAPSGTVYVEANTAAPNQNSILVFNYCGGALPSALIGRFMTGGSGAADLNNTGVLDADQQIVVNASQTLLFTVNQGSDTIAAFHIGAGGQLTMVKGSPFASGGSAPASVGISGNILVVANKASDGLRNLAAMVPNYTTFTIEADGSLTPTGSSYVLPLGSSPTQAFVAPGGDLVFATEESGVLRALQLSSDGVLSLAPGSPVSLPASLFTHGRPDPVWPAGLSASPTQHVLYTGIPNNNSIAAVSFTDAGVSTVIGGEADPNATLPCWSVVSADGNRLYFANAGSDNISVWDISADAQHPVLLQTFELPGGGNPWGLHIDPTGTLMFAITPRQIHQVPENGGQLLHALSLGSDGTIVDEIDGAPVVLPVPPDTNPFGVAVVPAQGTGS